MRGAERAISIFSKNVVLATGTPTRLAATEPVSGVDPVAG